MILRLSLTFRSPNRSNNKLRLSECQQALLTCSDFVTKLAEGFARLPPTSASSGWAPLGRGSDGRFGLRRFRAKLTPTPFGTHRAFTHALPPSFGLCSVPFTVPPCFFPLPL